MVAVRGAPAAMVEAIRDEAEDVDDDELTTTAPEADIYSTLQAFPISEWPK